MNITNCKFLRPFRINAIVIYPFVFYCDRHPTAELIQHESIHLDQIKRLGALKFYGLYVWEYFKGRRQGMAHDEAYRNISFEREAFDFPRKD